MLLPKLRMDVYDHKSQKIDDEAPLTEQERRAFEYMMSEAFQKKWDIEPNEFGEMLERNNKLVFKVATIDAIKKALEYL